MFLQLLLTGNGFKVPCIQLTSLMRSIWFMSFLKYKQCNTQTHQSLDLDPTLPEVSPQIVKKLLCSYILYN